jgi:nucleoside-diphosphate-sugar epimerase
MLHQPLTIYGDGQQTRDFVFVDDIVNGIMLTLDSDKSTGEIFNVGSGVATSVKALAQTMLSLTGAKLDIVKAAERPGEIKHSYGNVAKGKQILGYQPNYSLERGLKELLNENSLLKSP